MINRLGPTLILGLSCLLGCDASDEGTAPADAAVEVPRRPEAEPAEFAALTLRRPTDVAALEELIGPLRRGEGTVALAAGVTLAVEKDPATDERRIATLTLAPVGAGETVTLLRVPMSAAYIELFAEASLQGLAAVKDQETPSPFLVTYDVTSPNGGALSLKVGPGRLEVRMVSPATSLVPGSVGGPILGGDAHEVMSAQVRVVIDYLTIRRTVTSVFDPAAGGATVDLCEPGSPLADTTPHGWYDLCIRVSDPLAPVSVDVDLHTRDGQRLPIARSPGSIRTASLWISAIDRLALAASLGGDASVELPSATFDYRDPEVQGGAVFTASVLDGHVVFDHRSITPPSSLPDVEPLARPVASQPTPPPDDPCAAVGSVAAAAGHIVVDAQLDDGLALLGGFELPLVGDVRASIYHAEDVTLLGPREGAPVLETFSMPGLSLGAEHPGGTLRQRRAARRHLHGPRVLRRRR